MTTLTLFLHYGPHGHGGWHPGFFLFGPGLFWLGLLGLLALLVVMNLSRHTRPAPDRRREGGDDGWRPDPPAGESGVSGPPWPDPDAEPQPRPQPGRKDQDVELL